jgi:hypothetical protein
MAKRTTPTPQDPPLDPPVDAGTSGAFLSTFLSCTTVTVEVLVSHDGLFSGDIVTVPMDERTGALLDREFLALVDVDPVL